MIKMFIFDLILFRNFINQYLILILIFLELVTGSVDKNVLVWHKINNQVFYPCLIKYFCSFFSFLKIKLNFDYCEAKIWCIIKFFIFVQWVCKQVLKRHTGAVDLVAGFSNLKNESYIVSASADSTVRIWKKSAEEGI